MLVDRCISILLSLAFSGSILQTGVLFHSQVYGCLAIDRGHVAAIVRLEE